MLVVRRCFSSSARLDKVLTLNTMNQKVRQAEYAVRGTIPIRAEELKHELSIRPSSLPFKKVVSCNIGNPQEVLQKPLTFVRQVLSLIEYPALLTEENLENTKKLFPEDAIRRAKSYYEGGLTSTGAYSGSLGIQVVRDNVAKFIEERDGFSSNANKIFLTNGASQGVNTILSTLIQNSNCGVMIPIPQYPLYSATLTLLDGKSCPYYLQEKKNWSMDVKDLIKSLYTSRGKGIDVRALVVINPGNPTGNCLTKENMEEVVDFCHKENLVLLADEVYQENIYDSKTPFHSFKKVKREMGPQYSSVELVSFHSTSKGFIGECGKRGGYMELSGFELEVEAELYKLSSISLCPNVPGQITTDLMVNPPKPGDESYELYEAEKNAITESLTRRSIKLVDAFNTMEGVTCNYSQGSMYCLPRIRMTKKAIADAQRLGLAPDAFYCLKLLENTGVCTVPGSGFGQVDGTYHFRCTFLPREEEFDGFIGLMKKFHESFMDQYRV